jgi:hypothetical protein
VTIKPEPKDSDASLDYLNRNCF